MQKLLLIISCFATLFAEQMYLYEVSPIIGITENGKSTGMNSSSAAGIQLQYNDLGFIIKPEFMFIYSPNIEVYDYTEKANAYMMMFNGVYDVEYTALLTPYIKAGLGYHHVNDVPSVNTDSFLIGTGAGLKLNVIEHLALKFEAMVTWHDFQENNILVFGGLNFSFGNEDNTPVTENITVAHYSKTDSTKTTAKSSTTESDNVVLKQLPVFISKADHNLTSITPSRQEVVIRNSNKQLQSLTLFVPYIFRGYTLDDESKEILKGYAIELRGHDTVIKIIGHTDAKGRRAFNQELSFKRAEVVKELFVEYGVDSKRIIIKGHGESQPIVKGKGPEANRLNKRIEIRVQ